MEHEVNLPQTEINIIKWVYTVLKKRKKNAHLRIVEIGTTKML